MNWILENKEWLFSGIGVVIISSVIQYINSSKKKKTQKTNKDKSTVKTEVNITNNINEKKKGSLIPKSASFTKEELATRKKLTNILFVDDDTKFKIIKILNVNGWINTKIVKDIVNPDSEIVTIAHIMFIDINGVGIKMGFKDEGLGLALYLKKKYPEKQVVIYSSDTEGNRFHEALRKVDDFLPKNAEPMEFIELIEQYSAELELK